MSPKVSKPDNVKTAVRLILYSILVSALSALPTSSDSSLKALDSVADRPEIIYFVFGLKYVIAILGALAISRGENWARIAFLLFFLSYLPDTLEHIHQHHDYRVLNFALEAAAAVLLFTTDSALYFRKVPPSDQRDSQPQSGTTINRPLQ